MQTTGYERNPTWTTDELILALDLYLRAGLLDDSDPQVVELSRVLNGLPIHTVRPDLERFRTQTVWRSRWTTSQRSTRLTQGPE